jgi:hypothetical protein
MSMFASIPVTVIAHYMVKRADRLLRYFILITEERIVDKAIGTLMAAVAALALSGSAYAQSNNTLATPSTVSPAAKSTDGYGTPGAANTESGMSATSPNTRAQTGTDYNSNPGTSAFGSHNTLATPSTTSPANNTQ